MGELKVRLTREAAKIVSKLHPENKKLIRSALDEVRQNPHQGRDLQDELAGFKSYRIKRYRIVYKLNEEQSSIDIYYLGHRRDVYEQFRTLLNKLI